MDLNFTASNIAVCSPESFRGVTYIFAKETTALELLHNYNWCHQPNAWNLKIRLSYGSSGFIPCFSPGLFQDFFRTQIDFFKGS